MSLALKNLLSDHLWTKRVRASGMGWQRHSAGERRRMSLARKTSEHYTRKDMNLTMMTILVRLWIILGKSISMRTQKLTVKLQRTPLDHPRTIPVYPTTFAL